MCFKLIVTPSGMSSSLHSHFLSLFLPFPLSLPPSLPAEEEPFLIFANRYYLRKLNLDGSNYTLLKQVRPEDSLSAVAGAASFEPVSRRIAAGGETTQLPPFRTAWRLDVSHKHIVLHPAARHWSAKRFIIVCLPVCDRA